jgi:hypothetical protein
MDAKQRVGRRARRPVSGFCRGLARIGDVAFTDGALPATNKMLFAAAISRRTLAGGRQLLMPFVFE